MCEAENAEGRLQANYTHRSNGGAGPRLNRDDRFSWPSWSDRLPGVSDAQLIEGGLRTQGILKTGTPSHPLVSYVTIVRNNAITLSRTIESVQNQTYKNVEHILLDGASNDGTLDLIKRYTDRLDYFASEADGGLYEALNKAISLARGQLICVLNSDDWLDPHAAEIAVLCITNVHDAALLLTAANARSPDIEIDWQPALVHPGSYFMCADVCHNGIYATRSAYELSGPYDASYKIAADFKWIMVCFEANVRFVYSKEATINYSLGGASGDARQHSVECMRVVG